MRVPARLLVATSLVAGLVTPLAGLGTSSAAPARGVFEPRPASKPLYATKAPDADPERQRRVVEAADGVDLYVETWLPAAKGKAVPPKKVPTVLIMTPYVKQGVKRYGTKGRADVIAHLTARGYAVAQAHVRGTGESGGCLEQTAEKQIDDGARVVEYLGRDAPWSNGSVGMYGISYDAETQISVAGLGDKKRTKYLKAIVPVASVSGQYEYSHFDGVPYAGQAALSNAGYLALTSATMGETSTPQQYAGKLECQPELMAMSADPSGDVGEGWKEREYRAGASSITAATLHVHGLRDFNVQPIAVSGFFDRLPAKTPRVGLYGVWAHHFPDFHTEVEPDLARSDWLPMVTAWYDRWLKGARTGVEQWPTVQVQGSDGAWRAEPDFPGTGGPVGQLALGAEGTLGVTAPSGSTTYVEGGDVALSGLSGEAVFTTSPLPRRLQLTGQPVLDLWLTTDRPDGHINATVQVLGPNGAVLQHAGSSTEDHATYGYRSLQHLEPIKHNWFRQEAAVLPSAGTALRVPVRFQPTDLVVPKGGRLRITVSGSSSYPRETLPSGTASMITLLHDCAHPSALRFLTPRPDALQLDVREDDEEGPLKGVSQAPRGVDGSIASAKVCGKPPARLEAFVPTRALVARG
jgi:predicted acyl esterase